MIFLHTISLYCNIPSNQNWFPAYWILLQIYNLTSLVSMLFPLVFLVLLHIVPPVNLLTSPGSECGEVRLWNMLRYKLLCHSHSLLFRLRTQGKQALNVFWNHSHPIQWLVWFAAHACLKMSACYFSEKCPLKLIIVTKTMLFNLFTFLL